MTTKLQMITARRNAEFAAIAPIEFVEAPIVERVLPTRSVTLNHRPAKPIVTKPVANTDKFAAIAARRALENATVANIEFAPTAHILDLDFTPDVEPVQARRVPTVTPAPDNVRFNLDVAPFEYIEGIPALPGQEQEILEDATEAWWLLPQTGYSPIRVAQTKHHIVTLTAGEQGTLTLPLPALDLDLSNSGSAQELAARLRSCYRDTKIEWMVPVVDANWNVWDRDSETDPDSTSEKHPDKWASKTVEQRHVIARAMEKAHVFFAKHTLPIVNVWAGMDSAVANVIVNAIQSWKNPTPRAPRWTGDAQVETFDRVDYQDADLTAELVKSSRYDQEYGCIVSKWSPALYDSNRDLLYFDEYMDSATKDIAIDTVELTDIHIQHISGEVIGGNLVPDYFDIIDGMGVHVMTAKTHEIEDFVHIEREIRKPIGKGKYEVVGTFVQRERFSFPIEITQTGKLAPYKLTTFGDGTTFPSQETLAKLKAALVTWRDTKAETEAVNASPAHRQSLHTLPMQTVSIGNGNTAQMSIRHLANHKDDDLYVPRQLDSLSAAEAVSLLGDEFETGRLPEMVTLERIDNDSTVFYITETDTRYYADGTLMDDAAQVTSDTLVREPAYIPEGTLTLRYNVNKQPETYRIGRATIVENRMVDRLDKWAIKPEVALARVNAGIAAFKAAEAKRIEDERIAALPKPAKVKKGSVVCITPYSPLAHIEDGSMTIFVGKAWSQMEGSVLANGPTGHVEKYKLWLNNAYKQKGSPIRQELERIAALVREGESVRVMAWANAPKDASKKAKRTPPEYVAVIAKAVQFLAAK